MVVGIGARIEKGHGAEARVQAIGSPSRRSSQAGVDGFDGSVRRQSRLFRESVRRCEDTRAQRVDGIRALQVVALRSHITSAEKQTVPYVALESHVPLLDLRIPQSLIDRAQRTEAPNCRSEGADCS